MRPARATGVEFESEDLVERLVNAAGKERGGLPVVVLGGDHGDVPLEPASGAVIADWVVEANQAAVIDLKLFSKGEQRRFVTDFAERLFRRNERPLHVVIDEADAFAPQRPQRGEQRMLGAIQDLVRRGRARGIGLTLITQRSAVISKDVLTQVEVLVALRMPAPQDIKAIEAWIDYHGTVEDRHTVLKSLPGLPVGVAWFWSPGWLECLKKVAVRKLSTFDSSATPKIGKKIVRPAMRPVDFERLASRIQDTIERAQADDPEALKRRIAELQKANEREPAVLRRRIAELEEKAQSGALDVEACRKAIEAVDAAVAALDAACALIATAARIDHSPRALNQAPAAAPSAPPHPKSNGGRSNGASLPKGERAVLLVCAQHFGGASRKQVTILTGYKRSTRNTYLQRLQAAGYVRYDDPLFVATEAGVAALGADFTPLPTGDELRAHWRHELPKGERAVFDFLLSSFPSWVSRSDVGAALPDYQRSTRNTYIQRLVARQIVDSSGAKIRASEVLF